MKDDNTNCKSKLYSCCNKLKVISNKINSADIGLVVVFGGVLAVAFCHCFGVDNHLYQFVLLITCCCFWSFLTSIIQPLQYFFCCFAFVHHMMGSQWNLVVLVDIGFESGDEMMPNQWSLTIIMIGKNLAV